MRELSLFTGAGGGLLATHHLLGWETVGYVEIDPYCQRIIRARIDDGLLPVAPIFSDIRAFLRDGYAESYRGMVDVITGGFPCQPFSTAGKRLADKDERNMWPETLECLRMVRPSFALLENVPGLLAPSHRYFERILGDLAEVGFNARWGVLGADDAGAPHRRKRLWLRVDRDPEEELGICTGAPPESGRGGLSDAQRAKLRDKPRRSGRQDREGKAGPRDDGPEKSLADTMRGDEHRCNGESRVSWWDVEPGMGRVADGVAHRVDRLRALGNGQVPAVAALAWKALGGDLES